MQGLVPNKRPRALIRGGALNRDFTVISIISIYSHHYLPPPLLQRSLHCWRSQPGPNRSSQPHLKKYLCSVLLDCTNDIKLHKRLDCTNDLKWVWFHIHCNVRTPLQLFPFPLEVIQMFTWQWNKSTAVFAYPAFTFVIITTDEKANEAQ